MKNRKSIVVLGFTEFPYGFAEVQKIILISKSLIITGNDVTVICRNGYHNMLDRPEMTVSGTYEEIKYVYASGSCFRSKHFLKRRLNQIKGKINEFLILWKYKRNNNLDYTFLYTRNIYLVLYYRILSKAFGFKTILNYVEYYSAMKKRRIQIWKQLNDKLFDRYAPLITDAVLPISEFLIQHIKKASPNIKYLKIPVLTDFERYNGIKSIQSKRYFLFCGHAAYKEIIEFIIDSFSILNDVSVFLYLVVNGSENEMSKIENYVKKDIKKDNIKIFSKLSENQLFTFYKSAIALLIPLRPTFQDTARFPHKTGEYLASGNPVISTNYGEMKYYFKDKENMLLAESYDRNLFTEKMQFVITHPLEAQRIGYKGKTFASDNFDYINMAPHINDFLNSLK